MATTRKAPAGDGFISAAENPELVNQAIQEALATSLPEPESPPETTVTLPGGLVRGEHVISTAEVRELTGEHEEALARATQARSGNVFHFMNTLLECGVVRFGAEDPKQTKQLLKAALVGDRDALIIAIRRATYGDDVEIEQWLCPSCQQLSDLTVPLSDIPVRELEHPAEDVIFEVPLRGERTARCRLASGADQLHIFEDLKLTTAERDTLLLGRCLMDITDADGTRHVTTGLGNSIARNLGSADRHAILDQLAKRQPGPRFAELKFKHDACGNEVDLPIGLADMFRYLWLA